MQLITSILVLSSIFTGVIAAPDSAAPDSAAPDSAALDSAAPNSVALDSVAQFSNADVDDAECAGLGGVMRIAASDLPDGVSLSEVRKCVEHPLKSSRDKANWSIPPLVASVANATSPRVEAIAQAAANCYYEAKYGCSGGYCWKHCGSRDDDGQWCWTAHGIVGLGEWYTCKTWADCGTTLYACGTGVGCLRCGCGC